MAVDEHFVGSGNATEGVPCGAMDCLSSVRGTPQRTFPTGLIPTRINNFRIRPFIPFCYELPSHGIIQGVFDYFYQWLFHIKHAVVAASLPQATNEPVMPRLFCRVTLEPRNMVKHTFDLIVSCTRIYRPHLVPRQSADEMQMVGHQAIAE